MWFTDGPETYPSTPDRRPRLGRAAAPAVAPRAWRAARGVARCRRGAYTVEFSMVAAGLVTMMLAATEMAWQGLTAVALENGILQGSRTGSMGRLNSDGTRSGQACPSEILAAVRKGGGGLLNGSSLALQTSNFSNSKSAGLNQGGSSGAGQGGSTVIYTLTYTQPFVLIGRLIGRSNYVHTAVITVRNEPFAEGKSNAPPCT